MPRFLGENALFCADILPIGILPPVIDGEFFVPHFSFFSHFLFSTFEICGGLVDLGNLRN
jgi:hypothetical protein